MARKSLSVFSGIVCSALIFASLSFMAASTLAATPEAERVRQDFTVGTAYPLPEGIIVEKNVPVEMRDGLKLACNVCRPDKPWKCLIILNDSMQIAARRINQETYLNLFLRRE